jgi:large subunit ribosomal protein L41
LTPFVAASTDKTRETQNGSEHYTKRFTGEDYLKAWKLAGGYDDATVVQTADGKGARNMPEPFEERPTGKS